MKRVGVICCALFLIMAVPSVLFAGGYVNKSNLSVEYLRTLNRQAATDHADIVEFNPAGTVKLKDGFTINVSLQDQMLKVTNTRVADGKEFETDTPQFVPALYAVYKRNKWAGFFGFNVPLGGGNVEFDQGNYTTQRAAAGFIALGDVSTGVERLEAESYGLAFTLGGAYQISDLVSISLAGRYINAKEDLKGFVGLAGGDAIADVKQDATGFGGVIGLDFFPKDWLTIGLTYQSRISLDYDVEYQPETNARGALVLAGNNLVNGQSVRADLPAVFGTGVDVKVSDRLRYEVSFRYYFNKDADLRNTTDGTNRDRNEIISNSIEFGIAVEYAFIPKLKGSLGYLHSSLGGSVDYMRPELPELDANTFAGGLAWEVVKDLNLQFAGGMATYQGETRTDNTFSWDRNVPFLAFGVEYTF